MCQLHRRFSAEQVKFLLQAYCQGTVNRTEVQEILGIGKTRFFALLREYHQDPQGFSLTYRRTSPAKLSSVVENEIARQLLREKKLVENPHLPISGYNYSALRDRLKKKGISVSATTITRRAKSLGCYIPRRKTGPRDLKVMSASIVPQKQDDASYRLWSHLSVRCSNLRPDLSGFRLPVPFQVSLRDQQLSVQDCARSGTAQRVVCECNHLVV
jgi:hypothetical protein